MKQTTQILIIVSILVFIAGFAVGAMIFSASHGHDDSEIGVDVTEGSSHGEEHSHHTEGMEGIVHELYTVPEDVPAPSVDVRIQRDDHGGYNIHLDVDNFVFAPEAASGNHTPGEGHAHLYVDGEKIARVYSEWFHYSPKEAGRKNVVVTLNTNDHKVYAVGDEPIGDSEILTVTADCLEKCPIPGLNN